MLAIEVIKVVIANSKAMHHAIFCSLFGWLHSIAVVRFVLIVTYATET